MIIGIDLGTTNSTLAFSEENSSLIELFDIEQRISEDSIGEKKVLPSFYFFPLEEEEPCVGWYSKQRGKELPDRLIFSAKSWLCHDTIDRRQPFLPLSDFDQKRSPLEVCTAFLIHMRECFEKRFENLKFEDQTVLVTVPASFDPSARQLVQEATEAAGFSQVRLLEEPLAAFYAWLHTYQEQWRKFLKVGDTVLVVDIGGGTTDFSLISVEESEGDLSLERKAVGDHLLLGGDNIDLALAHLAQSKLSSELDEWQFQCLVHECRSAKEQLLSQNPKEEVEISIQGRGSGIIGGSLSVCLNRDEVESLLVDGFFPQVDLSDSLQSQTRSGIAKVGLSYARDPRVTAQLAHFLRQADCSLPSAVLFNGGTMKAAAFQQRIHSLLSSWRGEKVQILSGADLDFGVSRGAAYYGWTRLNQGIRVKAGTSCSYYIGVEGAAPAIPGVSAPLKKILLVPFGMEEGSEVKLDNQEFSLFLEEPVLFRFFSRNSKTQQDYKELHPIETVLHAQGENGKCVLVKLCAKVTELGVLELWCMADDGRKWKLEFDIRQSEPILAASSI